MNKQIIQSGEAPAPIGPYSQAVRAGNTVYLSGQIALEPASGQLITGDLVAETHQVMRNLQAVLAAAGLTFAHVVKTTIFLRDMADFGTVNEVYGSYLDTQPPARETVAVAGLPKDVRVEISMIAVASA
ncbi:MAG: RidA family protein [Bacteroidetes bacterium]|nr:MAG: RidA family protein [Bacteroidota bacterium]